MYCLSSCHQQLEQLLWRFCAFYEKVKQESWSGGPCHFVCPNFGLLSSGFSETFPFLPSVSFLCSLSLPVPPWCTEWHVMLAPWLNFNDPIITSIHVETERKEHGEEEQQHSAVKHLRDKKRSSVVWKICKNMQNSTKKIHLSLKMKLQAQNLV